MTTGNDLPYWIGFSLLPGVGSATILKLQQVFGDLEQAWRADSPLLIEMGLSSKAASRIVSERQAIDLDRELEKLERHNVTAIAMNSPSYPKALREIQYPPAVLYVRGALLPKDEMSVAMVGTRQSTTYGRDMTRRLAEEFAGNDVTVISGLALGIDGEAHRAALAGGGRTIAVCACGLDIIYPARHRELAERIIESGALVSEYPIGVSPQAAHFPARNRIISGMSRGVIVVEAPERSGALITASFAADQGRDVFAVPGSALASSSAGCHHLIREGAALVTSASEVMTELNMGNAQTAIQARMTLPTSDSESQLYEIIGAEPRHVDEIALQSGMTIVETSSLLMTLELKGLIRQQGSQHYVRA